MFRIVIKNTGGGNNKIVSTVANSDIGAQTLAQMCEGLQKIYRSTYGPETALEVFDGQRSVAYLDDTAMTWRYPGKVVDPDIGEFKKEFAKTTEIALALDRDMAEAIADQGPGKSLVSAPDPREVFQSSGRAKFSANLITFDPVKALDEMGVLAFAAGQRRKEPPVDKVNLADVSKVDTGQPGFDFKTYTVRPRPGSEPPPRWMWDGQPAEMEFLPPVPEPPLEQRPMKMGDRLLGGRKPRKFNFGEA